MNQVNHLPGVYSNRSEPAFRFFRAFTKTCCIVLLFFICIAEIIPAAESDIRYAADVDRLPAGSDIAAMGDVGVVLSGRAASAYWNPAAPAFIDDYTLSAEGADLYRHLSQHGCFTASAPLADNSGLSLLYLPFYSGVMEEYDTLPQFTSGNGLTRFRPKGYFKNYHHLLVVSMARRKSFSMPRLSETALKLPLEIAVGASLKAYSQMMDPGRYHYMGLGYNADIGVTARIGLDYDIEKREVSRELCIGAALRDILPSEIIWIYSNNEVWQYAPEGYREPFTYAQYYGVSFSDRSGDLPVDWTVALSLHKEYEVTYHGGIEISVIDKVLFRAGVSDRMPTLGAGVRYRNWFLDYAFRFDAVAISYARITAGVHLVRRAEKSDE